MKKKYGKEYCREYYHTHKERIRELENRKRKIRKEIWESKTNEEQFELMWKFAKKVLKDEP